jgi:mRNA-degrading endonuclease RelE of RelBE toxin-antitoxin system
MSKRITWENAAIADVRAIDREAAIRILRILGRYLLSDEGDVKRLQGIDPPEYRLRAGDYRIRFYDRGDSIHIISVRHRRDAYR